MNDELVARLEEMHAGDLDAAHGGACKQAASLLSRGCESCGEQRVTKWGTWESRECMAITTGPDGDDPEDCRRLKFCGLWTPREGK